MQADDLVLHDADPLGAGAAAPVLQQHRFGCGATLRERGLQALRDRGAQFALAPGVFVRELGEVGRHRIGVDERGAAGRRIGGRQHGKPR